MVRRSRYLLSVFAALATPTLVFANDSNAPSFAVKCWRVESSITNKLSIVKAAVDAACPVTVDLADLTAPFAPGDDVPAIWTVTLQSANTNNANNANAIGMPLSPTPPISATYVRTCDTIDTCDPVSVAAFTSTSETGNFSEAGEPLSFSTIRGAKFDRDGVFPIAAFVAVRDLVQTNTTYVFAAYASVTIKAKAAAVATQTQGVVRCRMTRQSALNATLDPSASVSESSNCEVRMALAPLAVVRPNDSVPVSWVATLAPRADADIHLPSPLTPMLVSEANQAYEIVASYVKLCPDQASARACDEYTPVDALQGQVAAGPASFSPTDKNVTFTSPPLTVGTAGRHTAMVHMVIAGPARRYDFMYYFELLATSEELSPEEVAVPEKADPSTSYCWDVLADATRTDATASSIASAANGSACPYTSTLSLPLTSLTTDTLFNLSFSLAANANYSALASSLATAVNLSKVYDPVSQTAVSLPMLQVYACTDGAVCSPFTPANKTLLRTLPAQNLEDGSATIRVDGLSFASEGNYTLMVYSVFPNGASRIDAAVYGAVSVTHAAKVEISSVKPESKSHTVAYVLVSVACVVAVVAVIIVAVWLRRRHQHSRMEKMVQFGLFPATRPTTGTVFHNTDSHGSGDSGRGSFSFLRVQASQPSPMDIETPRDGSLSYDPYERASFQDMSLAAESSLSFAFTENERPSTLTNDDFETGHKAYDV